MTMTALEEFCRIILSTKGKLTTEDFIPLAEKRGVNKFIIWKAIKRLSDDGLITQCGTKRPKEFFGPDIKVYTVAPGALKKLKPMRAARGSAKTKRRSETSEMERAYKKRANHPVMKACDRLDEAMANWV